MGPIERIEKKLGMSGRASRRRGVLGLFVVVVLLAGACSNAKTSNGSSGQPSSGGPATTYAGNDFSKNQQVNAQGVTSTEIHVGSITSKTNPLGTNVGAFNDGLKGYFDTVNAKGGVWGRKIKLTSERDDQLAQNIPQTEAMLSEDHVYAVFEAVELMTGASRLAAAGIPTFGWNIQADWAGPKNFFPNVAPVCFSGCPGGPTPHVLPWVAQNVHAHKVAVLAYGVPQAAGCSKGDAESLKMFGPKVGAKLVYSDDTLVFGQHDFSAQVAQMKDKGVDLLSTCLDYQGDEDVAKEMKKQGIAGKVTFFHPNLYDSQFVAKNASDLEGGILQVDITAFEHQPQIPAVKQYVDYANAHNIPLDEITAQGWVAGLQFVNALKAAGPNFTWPNLINSWNTEKWYTGNGWVPAIDWTREHTDPAKGLQFKSQFECLNFVKIHNGKFQPIWDDGGSKPWVCFNGQKATQWQTPVNKRFDTTTPFNLSDVQPGH